MPEKKGKTIGTSVSAIENHPVSDPDGVVKIVSLNVGPRHLSQGFFIPTGLQVSFRDCNLCLRDPKSTPQYPRPDLEYPLAILSNGGGEGGKRRKELNELGIIISSPGRLNTIVKYRPEQ